MISEHIYDDIPPKMKNLSIVIPILMHICSFIANRSVERQTTSNDVITDVNLFSFSISQDILLQIFDVIQSDLAL